MRIRFSYLGTATLIALAGIFSTVPGETAVTQQSSQVFWSGHSLTDPPIPQMLADISAGFDVPMRWNRHSMAGASLQARTRGRPANLKGWDGYRQGNNRDTVNMDVIEEFRTAASVGGKSYDTLIITEVHDFLWSVLYSDTVRLLRHYHERFIDGNPAGQTFFYQSWLDIYDKNNAQAWIDYERAAEPVWQCVVTRINTSLAAEGRSDRLSFLPASLSLVSLVEQAISGVAIPGITSDSTAATINQIFRDEVHLTDTGAYYIGLVSYAFTKKQSPLGAWAPDDMDSATALALQKLAWDFYNGYQKENSPLTLSECQALVIGSFAEQFWQFMDARKLHSGLSWYEAIWHKITAPIRVQKNILSSQLGFSADNPENPFHFEPDLDAYYWHRAP